jgi:hypothetical protein
MYNVLPNGSQSTSLAKLFSQENELQYLFCKRGRGDPSTQSARNVPWDSAFSSVSGVPHKGKNKFGHPGEKAMHISSR